MVKNVCAIIPAAGIGQRMGSDIPKQFLPVRGYPLVAYAVEAFLNFNWIEKVVVIVPETRIKELKSCFESISSNKLAVIKGSHTRHRSILEGFKYLQKESRNYKNWDVVIIHDGVRPYVDEKTLMKVVNAAEEYGAAGTICPLTSTVISMDNDGFLDTCYDRNKMSASEMPQAFRFSVALDAYISCKDFDLDYGTECLKIVQDYATDIGIKLIPCTPDYFKVTYPKDFYAVLSFIREKETVGIVVEESNSLLFVSLTEALKTKFKEVKGPLSELKEGVSNHVIIHEKNLLNTVIETENPPSNKKFVHPTSIVNICFHNEEEEKETNAMEIRQRAKQKSANRRENDVIYYVVCERNPKKEKAREISELIASLIFEANCKLNGNIFYV